MTLNVGNILNNRYRIAKLVGQGGFGAVYRAWDTSLSQPVALKENNDGGLESQRQFEREAKLLAGLRHPNLPRVSDHFIVPGQGQYLIMDYVEGKSLAALLAERGGPLGEAEVLPWIRQVADALEYLHTSTPPIIHRDIKPDNIIITDKGRAMLVDFGISKVYEANKGTTIGAKAVTPGFSPPEQYGRGRTDARSDVYALGATLYTLLTGLVPPEGPDLASGADTLTLPRLINSAVSEATSRAVVASMAPTISQRLGSVAGFRQLLPASATPLASTAPVVGQASASTTPVHALPAAPPGTKRTGVPVWGWLLGVLALVVLAMWAGATFGGRGGEADQITPEGTVDQEVVAEATSRPTQTPKPSPTPEPSLTTTVTPEPSPTAAPTPEPQAGDVRIVMRGGVEVEQVYVPAGSFMMGSEDGREHERPVHEVTLNAFWIDRTEVTNAQYAACVADEVCNPPQFNSSYTRDRYYDDPTYANYPVIWVNWDDAATYAARAGGRLPTEAEWEYVARGPENRVYPWGDTFDGQRLNFCDLNCLYDWADKTVDDGYADTAPVGNYPEGASWVGALDMAGNVWEWVNDWYNSEYYTRSPELNPLGPESGEHRTERGGSWGGVDQFPRAAYRGNSPPDHRGDSRGFRVVEPLSAPGS